ncbi:alpha/beta hydrolase [Shimia aestuarii]|uniref:alpha/beta hydrolase n=1 Tax=Shimia aestuarii TaxID=254406 RepID=UPI001FB427A2|nr:alpha/beta hydrolase [Shimia aestuarii]
MTAEGRILFDGERLRACLFNAEAPKLIVTFRQRVTPDGAFSESRPVQRFVKKNYAHLHLQARCNDWYINQETDAFEARLREIVAPYRRVVGTGFSMGGYGVLRFSKALGLQHAILISPQFSIAPEVVPRDRRYRDSAVGFDAALGDVARRAKRGMKGVILADPFRPLDIYNAGLIQEAFPKLALCRLGCGGHPATRVLGESGGFGRVQGLLLRGQVDPSEIIGLHRAGRRESATYWRHLAETAEARGRAALAQAARGQQAAREAAAAKT